MDLSLLDALDDAHLFDASLLTHHTPNLPAFATPAPPDLLPPDPFDNVLCAIPEPKPDLSLDPFDVDLPPHHHHHNALHASASRPLSHSNSSSSPLLSAACPNVNTVNTLCDALSHAPFNDLPPPPLASTSPLVTAPVASSGGTASVASDFCAVQVHNQCGSGGDTSPLQENRHHHHHPNHHHHNHHHHSLHNNNQQNSSLGMHAMAPKPRPKDADAARAKDKLAQRKLRNKESARRYREKQVARRRHLEHYTRSLADQNRELESLHDRLLSLTCEQSMAMAPHDAADRVHSNLARRDYRPLQPHHH